jgi:hypothetical protein
VSSGNQRTNEATPRFGVGDVVEIDGGPIMRRTERKTVEGITLRFSGDGSLTADSAYCKPVERDTSEDPPKGGHICQGSNWGGWDRSTCKRDPDCSKNDGHGDLCMREDGTVILKRRSETATPRIAAVECSHKETVQGQCIDCHTWTGAKDIAWCRRRADIPGLNQEARDAILWLADHLEAQRLLTNAELGRPTATDELSWRDKVYGGRGREQWESAARGGLSRDEEAWLIDQVVQRRERAPATDEKRQKRDEKAFMAGYDAGYDQGADYSATYDGPEAYAQWSVSDAAEDT